jgi:uncharacterized protein
MPVPLWEYRKPTGWKHVLHFFMVDDVIEYLNNPHWGRQGRWRRAVWRTFARVGLTGVHALPVHRRWVEIHRRSMVLRGLDPALDGLKLVQLSDLHYSPVVWRSYLAQFIDWVNNLEPDLVVITGDLITGGYRYANRVASLLAKLKAPQGVICTFGNHDYSMFGKALTAEGKRRADHLERSLIRHGLIVLRNRTHYVCPPGAHTPVALVGLDDEWSGSIDADGAFADVDPNLPIVCLNHNPANCNALMNYPWQWMLSGHTHGRQLATSAVAKRLYPHKFRQFTHGYYAVNGRHLYVNRGLSYGQRVLEWCRPEVTVFRLEAEPGKPRD